MNSECCIPQFVGCKRSRTRSSTFNHPANAFDSAGDLPELTFPLGREQLLENLVHKRRVTIRGWIRLRRPPLSHLPPIVARLSNLATSLEYSVECGATTGLFWPIDPCWPPVFIPHPDIGCAEQMYGARQPGCAGLEDFYRQPVRQRVAARHEGNLIPRSNGRSLICTRYHERNHVP